MTVHEFFTNTLTGTRTRMSDSNSRIRGHIRGRVWRERLERQIQACPEHSRRVTDKAIDRLVYELYGLSEEEIKIIEASHVPHR